MANENLIYDGDKLRDCDYNRARVSISKFIWEYELKQGSYLELIKYNLTNIWKGFLGILILLVSVLLLLLVVIGFPIMLPLRAYITRKNSRENVERMGEDWKAQD